MQDAGPVGYEPEVMVQFDFHRTLNAGENGVNCWHGNKEHGTPAALDLGWQSETLLGVRIPVPARRKAVH